MEVSGRRGQAILVSLLVLCPPTPAAAAWGDSAGLLGVGGSLRLLPALIRNPEVGLAPELEPYRDALEAELPGRVTGLTQSLLRLTAAGRPLDWVAYEAHLVTLVTQTSGTAGAGLASGLFQLEGGRQYRVVDESWRWLAEEEVEGRLEVDRLAVKLRLGRFDLTLGRQAVTFGKAWFWNPLDVFRAFSPYQLDRDYKPGVDAARLDLTLGDFSGATLVAASGPSDDRWPGSALLSRVFATWHDWDLTLQGGRVRSGMQLGGGGVGELGPLEVRAEAAWFTPVGPAAADLAEPPVTLAAVVGLGHRFESGLALEAEYLYNPAGATPPDRAGWNAVAAGYLLHTSRHVVGLLVSHELTPLMRGSLASLVAPADPSVLLQPGLIYSAADEVELVAGALLSWGRGEVTVEGLDGQGAPVIAFPSEFGTYPWLFYVEAKLYF